MQIGVSTACFYPQVLEDALFYIIEMGFKKIEIFFNTESEIKEPFLSQICQIVNENDLEVVSIHPYTSLMEGMLLFSNYERRTKDGFEQYRGYLKAAKKLNAKYLTFHGEKQTNTNDNEQAIKRKIERYNALCKMASEYNVIISQENVAWCKSSNPDYLKILYDNVKQLYYTLDLKQVRRAGYDWREYYNIIKKRLVNIHINDFNENDSCLLPGKGTFDYKLFFEMLKKDNYKGDALIEVYTSNYYENNEILKAAEFLRNIK